MAESQTPSQAEREREREKEREQQQAQQNQQRGQQQQQATLHQREELAKKELERTKEHREAVIAAQNDRAGWKPTPTQEENDRAALGEPVLQKEDDGSPAEDPVLTPQAQQHRALESGRTGAYETRQTRQHRSS